MPPPRGYPRSGTSVQLVHDVSSAKRALRARIRAERRGRDPRQRQDDAEALAVVIRELPEIKASRCVTAYVSMPTEPATGPLRKALHNAGIRVLLPIVLPGGVLEWAEDSGLLRPASGPGGDEPIGPRLGVAAIATADVILIPALAVDTLGYRLGQGAGYYDRALPLAAPGVPVIAIVNTSEVLDAAVEPVPTEPHDCRVDAVVTPRGCLHLQPTLRWPRPHAGSR
ncbi:MAG TPA: 5-formyltetrahydrofolate cyclo-ligase [Kineosporiaceae bacterium]|nr:5-formyltetrahydrofolate cyclo-ligase [Kineosporiaceae bacterium]